MTPFTHNALLLVDIQNDFCPGGALPVAGGDEIVPVVNRLIPLFVAVVAGRDWHPPNHCSFRDQGGPWPPHCVADTPGAAYHPDLDQTRITHEIRKATAPDREAYSDFAGHDGQGRRLDGLLRQQGVDGVWVTGLATDYCVRASTLDALRLGYSVRVVTDAIRAVDVKPGDGQRALQEMRQAGAKLVTSADLLKTAASG